MRLSDLIPINREFFIWDAVVAWRDHIRKTDFYNCSKGDYFTNMKKLIKSNVIDIRLQLKHINNEWLKNCENNIDNKVDWSKSTKTVRKSCLNHFYNFVNDSFDRSTQPYQRHPKANEIEYILSQNIEEKDKYEALEKTILKHVFSNVADKEKVHARDVCPIFLCNELSKINERDAYIVLLMMLTGQPLEKILNRRKENLRISYMHNGVPGNAYLDFDNDSEFIPPHISRALDEIRKNSTVYIFETSEEKKVTRAQVNRNLKKAGRNIGLDFDLTPKTLRSYVCEYMSKDKRSELEKGLGI